MRLVTKLLPFLFLAVVGVKGLVNEDVGGGLVV